jgi:hypothetical protein
MIHGEPKPMIKAGTLTTVDMETGEVVSQKRNAFSMLPPSPDVCQVCATDHAHDQPHNKESIYYQMQFHATHGRYPKWSDAMAHCAPEIRDQWCAGLIKFFSDRGMDVPEDLMDGKPTGR